MTRIKNLAKDTLIYGLAVVLNPLINTFVLLKLLTTQLDTYQFGVYNYFYPIAGILIVVYSMRMETTYFRMTNDYGESKVFAQAFYIVMMASTILSLFLWFNSHAFAAFMGEADYSRYLRYFAIILWLDAFCAVPFARLRHREKSLKFALLKIFNVLLTLVLILALFFVLPKIPTESLGPFEQIIENKLWLDGLFICNLIASFVLFLYFGFHLIRTKLTAPDLHLIKKKMLPYTIPLVLISLAGNSNQFLDRILLPFFSSDNIQEGMSNTGIYGSATKIATIMLLFSKAFNYAFDPYVFKAYKENKNTDHLARIALSYTIVSSVILVFSICFSDVLSLLLGADFKSGMQYVPLLLFAYLLIGLYYHFGVWYKLTDQTMKGAIIAILGVIVTFFFNLILVPKIGLYGPALTIIVNYLFMSVLCLIWARNYLVISYPLGRMAMHVLWSLLFAVAFIFIFSKMSYSYVYAFVLFAVYLISIYWVERKSFRSMLASRKL